MSDEDNRLEKEFEEVQDRFANHPHISIVSTEGSPVNKYIVEFRVQGLVRLDDGEIAKSDQHRIEITLSFGFPHFPPNCKPLTQIFHPDIDPSAIKIADFWKADETLAALIIHIAQMICWQVYSKENVFNQEAASWLIANSDSVPLDSFDFSAASVDQATDLSEDTSAKFGDVDLGLRAEDLPELAFGSVDLGDAQTVSSPEQSAETEGGELKFSIDHDYSSSQNGIAETADIVKDLDFGFKAPGITEDKEDEPAEIVVEEIDIDPDPQPVDEVEGEIDFDFTTVDVDYDILCGMLAQHNYFAALRKINLMAPENLSKASADMRPEIEKHIRDAEKIFKEAKELEGQGLLEEAARKFEGVLHIVKDYPDLEVNMKRVRNAWMAAMEEGDAVVDKDVEAPVEVSLSLENKGEKEAVSVPAFNEFEQPQVSDSLSFDQPMPPPSSPAGAWSPPDKGGMAKKKAKETKAPGQKIKSKRPLLIACGVVLLTLALSGWVFQEWTTFNKAQEKWVALQVLLEKGEYDQVSQQCAEITALLDGVHIVMASGKKKLLAQVQDLSGSEHFQEAMGGKIYYKDQYISKMAHAAYLEIEKLVAAGEKNGAVSDWQQALVSYEAALAVAEKNKNRLDESFYNGVVFKVKQAQFANHVAQGKKAFISKAWPAAISNFSKAMELAKTKNVADPTSSHDVNRYLQRARFSQFLVDGDAYLQKGSWKEAVVNYQEAHDIARNDDMVDRASRESVTLKLHQTTLMKGLTEGDKFSQLKKWNQAIVEYEKAESVLPYDITIPGQSVVATQERVASSLLNALYNRDQEEARAYFANKEYVKSVAALERSIRAIDSSPLKDKAKWQLTKKQIQDDLKQASLQGVIEEKTAYLEEHYKDIFVENFDGVRLQFLDQPQIKFLEAMGSALVFRMRCRELRDLKHFTLELIYQYDMATDKWGFQGGN